MCAIYKIMAIFVALLFIFTNQVASDNYLTPGKEHFLTDVFLREVVNRMGKDLAEVAADSFLDFPDSSINRQALRDDGISMIGARSPKDVETEERLFPLDYDTLGSDTGNNINPSIRDQEYLQHSSLWGNQYVSGGAGEGKQHLKPEGTIKNHQEIKTDSNLPAYCNPPNPCPVGYTEDQGCTSSAKFENTAAFSRRYQAAQDCMCDTEHMFDCPIQADHQSDSMSDNLDDMDFGQYWLKKNNIDPHRTLVAKKFYITKDQNPFLQGERLPVAAKKGNNVLY